MTDSFVTYRSFHESLAKLNDPAIYGEVMYALNEYALNENEDIPFSSPVAEALFIAFKPQVEASQTRYQECVSSGKSGGRPEMFTDREKEEIRKERKNGATVKELALKFSCSERMIYSICKNCKNCKNLNDNDNDNDNANLNYNLNLNGDGVSAENEGRGKPPSPVGNQNTTPDKDTPDTCTATFSLKDISAVLGRNGISTLTERQLAITHDSLSRICASNPGLDGLDYLSEAIRIEKSRYPDKDERSQERIVIGMMCGKNQYLGQFVDSYFQEKDKQKEKRIFEKYKAVYKKPPAYECPECHKKMNAVQGYDEFTHIAYTAYKCDCGRFYECEKGIWKLYKGETSLFRIQSMLSREAEKAMQNRRKQELIS